MTVPPITVAPGNDYRRMAYIANVQPADTPMRGRRGPI